MERQETENVAGRRGQGLTVASGEEPLTLDFTGTGGPGTMPVDLDWFIAGRGLAQATSRAGKSWLARFILEQTHGQLQHIIVDPEGEFASLRESFPYLLVSAEAGAGDILATVGRAPALCRGVMEAGVSVILDIYEMDLDVRQEFVGRFLGELMALGRSYWRPLLVVIDEAHEFAPQDGTVASSRPVASLTSKGGKRAYGSLLLTHRLSNLDKNVVANLSNRFIGWTTQDVDVKRAAENLGFSKSRHGELRGIGPGGVKPGQFFAYGPAFPTTGVVRVKSGPVVTTHPEAGKVAAAPPPAPAGLTTVIAELSAAVETTDDTLDGATEPNGEEREDAAREGARKPGPRERGAAETNRGGSRTGDRAERSRLEREIAGLKRERGKLEEKVQSLEESNAGLLGRNAEISAAHRDLQTRIAAARKALQTGLNDTVVTLEMAGPEPQASEAMAEVPGAAEAAGPPAENTENGSPESGSPGSGSPGSQAQELTGTDRILETLLDLEGIGMEEVPRPALAVLSGFKNHRSGTFQRYVADLASGGMVHYPEGGSVELTGEGGSRAREIVDGPGGSPGKGSGRNAFRARTLAELHDRWLSRLEPGTRRIVDELVPLYPDGLDREELAARAGFKNGRSGTFQRYVGVLNKVGFVHYPERGTVAMSTALFPEGLAATEPEGS